MEIVISVCLVLLTVAVIFGRKAARGTVLGCAAIIVLGLAAFFLILTIA